MKLYVGQAAIIEVQATVRSGAADPTAAVIDIAIRFFKDGHANDGHYWTGAAWQAGAAFVASTQKDFHAHEYALPNTALVAGMEWGRVTARCAHATSIGDTARFDIVTTTYIQDKVWDEVLIGSTHNVKNSAGRRLREIGRLNIREGTAQGPGVGPNQIQLDAGASSVNDIYDTNLVVIIDGTGVGQTRIVLTYDGTTKVATVNKDWDIAPDASSEFVLVGSTIPLCSAEGLLQDATGSTATLNGDASVVDSAYSGAHIVICSGVGAGQSRLITDYVGSTRVVSVSPAWGQTPDTTSAYAVIPLGRVVVESAGTGLYEVTIHVQDGAGAPLGGVKVHIFDAANTTPIWYGETDSSGNAKANLKAGTFAVRLAKGLTGFTVPESMVVTKDETFTFVGTVFAAPTPSDPAKCVVWGFLKDAAGEEVTNARVDVYAVTPQNVSDTQMGEHIAHTKTDEDGYWQIELIRLAEVWFEIVGAGVKVKKIVPDAADQNFATL